MDVYCHFAFISQLIVRSHHGSLKDLITINNYDVEEEILSNHKKRFDHCFKDYIIQLYHNLILPQLFKNEILESGQIKDRENLFSNITDEIIKTITNILNDEKFRLKKVYFKLYMNQGKIPGISKYLSYQIFFLGKLINSILLESDKMNSTIGLGFLISDNLTTKQFNEILDKFLIEKGYIVPEEEFEGEFETLNERRRYILNKVKKFDNTNLEREGLICLLSVPTGFGKTYSGLYYGSIILSPRSNTLCSNFFQINPRIIYSLPFLSIIDQVETVIKEFLQKIKKDEKSIESTSFLVHHHLTEPIFNINNDIEYDESTAELFVKSWNSQYILSTFNQLLNTLFKSDKNSSIKFSKVLNSTWILDEVQSIPLKYWKTLEEFLLIINNLFLVNILMMSATLPKIIDKKRLKTNNHFQNLNYEINEIISDEEYKKLLSGINRINLEYYGNISFGLFLENLENLLKYYTKENKNILVVCNTRKMAQTVYNFVKELKHESFEMEKNDVESVQVEFLAATQTPNRKSKVIEKIKNQINFNTREETKKKFQRSIILISTQCIEAGVDLDFDVVIRDFAPLDNIIQVAGRCNRNNRENTSKGIVKVYKVSDDKSKNKKDFCQYIYDPHLLRLTEDLFQQTRHRNNFPYIYQENEIYNLINRHYEMVNNFFIDGRMEETRLKYEKNILNFEYLTLSNDFNLISNFSPYSIYIEEDQNAIKIIEKYKSLVVSLKNAKSFPKDEFNELLRVKKIMQKYIITAYLNSEELAKLENVGKFGDLYIIPRDKLNEYYSNKIGFYII